MSDMSKDEIAWFTAKSEIQENGPGNAWDSRSALSMKTDDRVGVASDDFDHDVILWVSGDFANREQKLRYAEEIARRLNEWKEKNDER